jgi:hypothetical protein
VGAYVYSTPPFITKVIIKKNFIYVFIVFLISSYSGFIVRVMVFNATVNYISVISWRSVVLEEEIGALGEIHRSIASH